MNTIATSLQAKRALLQGYPRTAPTTPRHTKLKRAALVTFWTITLGSATGTVLYVAFVLGVSHLTR